MIGKCFWSTPRSDPQWQQKFFSQEERGRTEQKSKAQKGRKTLGYLKYHKVLILSLIVCFKMEVFFYD